MDEFYNHIQYVVPKKTRILFKILPNWREIFLKLLDGDADVYVKDKTISLPLHQEVPIQDWEWLCTLLKTVTGCNFLVREYHYASDATERSRSEKPLFAVSPSGNNYSFVLEKDIHILIFPVKSTGQESSITISCSRGTTEISGFKLSRGTNYHLSPFTPVLLKSFNEEPYSVYVNGLDRKVKLFIRDEDHHECVNYVNDRIFNSHLPTIQLTHNSPTVLVLGPKNAGKTSFCQLLLNKTLKRKMSPIYVDLNVQRNLSVPGSLSLSEIEGRLDCTLDFKYNIQKLLHYGSLSFDSNEIEYYYYLVRKMGELLTFYLNYNSNANSFAIIDTDGFHGENNTVIELILQSFAVDLVVYIGDEQCYENLKTSLLAYVSSEFIPKPCNAEQPSNSYEERYYQYRIQKYFFGSNNPSTRNARNLAFQDLTIYRISTLLNDNSTAENVALLRFDLADCNLNTRPTILNCLFGVCAEDSVEFHEMTEIKYYVYFTAIDMAAEMATVMVPESENFDGGILIMGSVPTFECDQII